MMENKKPDGWLATVNRDQAREIADTLVKKERERIKKIIRDDSLAAQYDTFPKYRTALLRAISRS